MILPDTKHIINKANNPDGNLRVEIARNFNEIEEFAESWDMLALNAKQQHPAMTHAWISAYLKACLKEGESWFCLFAFDNDDLVGVLPLLVRDYSFLMKRYLMLRTPYDKHTMCVDFLFKEKYGIQVIQTFTNYLNGIYPKVIRLQMGRISCNSGTLEILNYLHGISASYYPHRNVSIIRIEGSFSNFRKSLSKKFTGNLRRSNNSLKKFGNLSFKVINNGKESQESFERFTIMENSGWKGAKGSSIKDKYWGFFDELIRNLAKKKWLEWYFLEAGDQDLAGYMIIPFGRTIYIFQTCYNEEFRSHSPGVVLTEKILEHIFRTGKYDTINFLGDPEWLLRWKVDLKPYYILMISFRNPASFLLTHIPYLLYSKLRYARNTYKAIRRLFK